MHSWECYRLTQWIWLECSCSLYFFYKLTLKPLSQFTLLPTFLQFMGSDTTPTSGFQLLACSAAAVACSAAAAWGMEGGRSGVTQPGQDDSHCQYF